MYCEVSQNHLIWGGDTVAQAVAPTIYGLECPRGHGFESDPRSFADPTPHHFSPSHFLSKPSLSYLIKGKKPKIKSFKKKEGCVCQMKMNRSRICLCLLCDNTVWTSHRVPFMLPRPERKP